MAWSAFDDKLKQPKDDELASVLGRSSGRWVELVAQIGASFEPLTQEWTFAGKKWGWSLRLKHKKRAIVYLTPRDKHFTVGFAFGEKAVKAAHAARLPKAVLTIIDEGPKYAEGRAVRLEVWTKKDVAIVEKLAEIKMAN